MRCVCVCVGEDLILLTGFVYILLYVCVVVCQRRLVVHETEAAEKPTG